MTTALALDDVTLGYDGHPAVHHLTGRFAAGSLTAICGPNGAGKSTLIKGLVGALKPLGGRIDRGGCDTRAIGYLPQAAEIDRSFPIDVFDFVALGRVRRAGLFGRIGAADRHAVAEAIAAVGLEGFEARQIGALSGGQTQRMLFARLMLQEAGVILLDEPFAAVDERTTGDLVGLIARWH
ncbi:MAG: ABC transporter ATP-binding protein, partial [Rhodoblastus sp.]|nr:ABC transporter ATP-binding protein [Rhodoblastus sp.]